MKSNDLEVVETARGRRWSVRKCEAEIGTIWSAGPEDSFSWVTRGAGGRASSVEEATNKIERAASK